MKTNIFLTIFLVLLYIRIQAQDTGLSSNHDKTFSLNIQLGLNQIKEMNLLPLVHRGTLKELSFETEKINNTLRKFQFLLIYSRIKTSLEEFSRSGNLMFGLNYSYNFLIFQKNNFRYYLGPQASLCYSFMLFPNWDDSHGYWADYMSVGPNNIFSVSLGHDSEWFTFLNLTILSFFSRPEEVRQFKMDESSFGGILKSLNSDIEPGQMNKVFHLTFKSEYRFPVFVTKREALTYSLDITCISGNDGQPIFQIINRFGIKIMI